MGRHNFTIPVGEMKCKVCGEGAREGEEVTLVMRAGSAWKPENVTADGEQYVPLEEGAELYTFEMVHTSCEAGS